MPYCVLLKMKLKDHRLQIWASNFFLASKFEIFLQLRSEKFSYEKSYTKKKTYLLWGGTTIYYLIHKSGIGRRRKMVHEDCLFFGQN